MSWGKKATLSRQWKLRPEARKKSRINYASFKGMIKKSETGKNNIGSKASFLYLILNTSIFSALKFKIPHLIPVPTFANNLC